jgi:hypothetical protein
VDKVAKQVSTAAERLAGRAVLVPVQKCPTVVMDDNAKTFRNMVCAERPVTYVTSITMSWRRRCHRGASTTTHGETADDDVLPTSRRWLARSVGDDTAFGQWSGASADHKDGCQTVWDLLLLLLACTSSGDDTLGPQGAAAVGCCCCNTTLVAESIWFSLWQQAAMLPIS